MWVCGCVGGCVGDRQQEREREISTIQYSVSSTAFLFLVMTSHFLGFDSKNCEIII